MNTTENLTPGLLRYSQPAMASTFELYLAGETPNDARQVAREAFETVAWVEGELSRFISTSDVSRINRLATGASTVVSPLTSECLALALDLFDQTEGCFDGTVGARLRGRRSWIEEEESPGSAPAEEPRPGGVVGMKHVELNRVTREVTVTDERVELDLGGIGKGFAVDRVVDLLQDWGVTSALVHAGQSTMRAVGPPPDAVGWPMRILDPRDEETTLARYELAEGSVSASAQGTSRHILDPHSGEPAESGWLGAWAFAPTAALSDALSTAFSVMTAEQVEAYCGAHPSVGAVMVTEENGMATALSYGETPVFLDRHMPHGSKP